MPVSQYFNNYIHSKNEQSMYMTLADDVIKMWGNDVYYIPRESSESLDLIYGEDVLKYFDKAYLVAVYQENNNQYMGAGLMFSRMGIEIQNEVVVYISEVEFAKYVRDNNNQLRPQEGDLIYIPQLNKVGELYEIKYVNDNSDFNIFGKRMPHYYKMNLAKFRYSNERISTGIDEIDQIQVEHAYSKTFFYKDMEGEFESFDIVYQSPDGSVENLTARGTVTTIDNCCNSFTLMEIAGQFKNNEPAYVFDSDTTFTLSFDADDKSHDQPKAVENNQIINLESKIAVTDSDNATGVIGNFK